MAKKVLVIDDEKDLLEIVTIMLKTGGCDVSTAPDAESGLKICVPMII